jgi:hypothetical protein
MKRLILALVLALAVIGGAITVAAAIGTHVAACPPGSSRVLTGSLR